MSNTYQPCRVLILATLADDSCKKVSIANTGYGTQRHADRWLARGAKRVNVTIWSNSTGRQIESDTYYDAATKQATDEAQAGRDAHIMALRAQPNEYSDKTGARVEHETFGFGSVVSAGGAESEARVIVNFDNEGLKTLHAAYAVLKFA